MKAMRRVLRTGKSIVLTAAHGAGVFDAIRDGRCRQQRLLLLACHGVSLEDEHEWNPGTYMSPEKFESRLAAVERGSYTVLMNADEVAELAGHAVDFQLHTHRLTCPRDADALSREIRENRLRIEPPTSQPARRFCCPSGDYASEFLPWLEKERVASATTCDPGQVTSHSSQLLLFRFVDPPNVSAKAWLSGAAALLPGGRRYAHGG
jgi:hypothetical protein